MSRIAFQIRHLLVVPAGGAFRRCHLAVERLRVSVLTIVGSGHPITVAETALGTASLSSFLARGHGLEPVSSGRRRRSRAKPHKRAVPCEDRDGGSRSSDPLSRSRTACAAQVESNSHGGALVYDRRETRDMASVQKVLAGAFTAEFAARWLSAPNTTLEGKRPEEVIKEGGVERVLEAAAALVAGDHR